MRLVKEETKEVVIDTEESAIFYNIAVKPDGDVEVVAAWGGQESKSLDLSTAEKLSIKNMMHAHLERDLKKAQFVARGK
jgi:phage gp45-like